MGDSERGRFGRRIYRRGRSSGVRLAFQADLDRSMTMERRLEDHA
jgi:hypothetical protein